MSQVKTNAPRPLAATLQGKKRPIPVKHEAKHESSAAAVGGACPRCVRPLARGGDEEPGAALPQLPGALRAAPARGEPPAPAPRPLRALEDVPEVREHPGPGERPLHGV